MAVQRQENWQGQQRVDVPHLRAIESGVSADFDVLAGIVIAGKLPVVASGFKVVTAGAVGNDAEKLVLQVAGSSVIHFEATEAGSIFRTPEDRANEILGPTNPRLTGSFTPNSTNFVGIDIIRTADDSTADTVMFLNPETETESSVVTPLARTADYQIVVSTTEFSATPGLAPLAIVRTDAQNKVTSLTDARYLLFRLGSGGSNPLSVNPYSWPGGRAETGVLADVGGDRSISSLKDWMNAMMTRLWELGGGEYWYSLTADRNVRMFGTGTVFTSTGEYFEVISNNLHWRGLKVTFDNSTAILNEIANQTTSQPGLTDLADGECLYVDLDRTTNRTIAGLNPLAAAKAPLATLGGSATPGQRLVLAWRSGSNYYVRDQPYAVGGSFKVATTLALGTVRIVANAGATWDASAPVASVIAMNASAYYTATAGGLSHNLDVGGFGSASSLLTSGDLRIGRGTSAGDEDIILETDGAHSTKVRGEDEAGALAAISYADGGTQVSRRRNRTSYDQGLPTIDGTTRFVSFTETDGAHGMALTTTTPASPEPTTLDPCFLKYFARPSKRWLTPVTWATAGPLQANTAFGSGSGKVLQGNVAGQLFVDGQPVGLFDRVLVKDEANPVNNGIYKVTIPGGGGAYLLTRATDFDHAPEVVSGVAVHVESAGDTNSESNWVLSTPDAISVDQIGLTFTTANLEEFTVRKANVLAATAAPLPANTYSASGNGIGSTLTAMANGALTVDGAAIFTGDRVLVKDEVDPLNNGIYVATDGGTVGTPYILTRAPDADTAFSCCYGMGVKVTSGTVNINTTWKLTTENFIVVDQTSLNFLPTDLETRHQWCIRWYDGSIGVVSESPFYEAVF